jgi:hypothetical protein
MTEVIVLNGSISEEEKKAYLKRASDLYPGKELETLEIKLDGDFVDLTYHFKGQPFERIRRITGYLVGTLDRFNDAKRAEEHDRVKHDACSCEDSHAH